MANRYDIVHIDFQASARGANAAIESIRQEVEKSSSKIEEFKKNLDNAFKSGASEEVIAGIRSSISTEEKRFKQLTQAQNELIKGMRVLDKAVQMFNDGALGSMNAAFQKAANNAAKLAQSKMDAGSKEWREMGAIMQETEQNYARMQRDTDQLIQAIQNGGSVFTNTLEQEKRGLKELMGLVPYMGQEYQKLAAQYDIVKNKIDNMIKAERQERGEIVDSNDAKRVAYQLTKEGAEAAEKQREQAEKNIDAAKKEIATLEERRKGQEAVAKESANVVATHNENIDAMERSIAATEKQIGKDNELADSKAKAAQKSKEEAEALRESAKAMKLVIDENRGVAEGLAKDIEDVNKNMSENATAHKQKVEEVKQNIQTLNAEPIKPKVDTKDLEILNGKLKEVQDKIGAKNAEIEKLSKDSLSAKWNETLNRLKGDKEARLDPLGIGDEKQKLEDVLDVANKFYEIIKNIKGVSEDGFFNLDAAEPIKQLAEYYKITEEEATKLIHTLEQSGTVAGKFTTFRFDDRFGMNRVAIEQGKGMDDQQVRIKSAEKYLERTQSEEERRTEQINKLKTEKNELEGRALELEGKIQKAIEGTNQTTDESIKLTQKQKTEIDSLEAQNKTLADAISELTKANNGLTESQENSAEAAKKNAGAMKMTAEEAKSALEKMNEVSTFKIKTDGSLEASNLEQAQQFLLAKIKQFGSITKEGKYQLLKGAGNNQFKDVIGAFKDKFGIKDDDYAWDIIKQLSTGGKGLIKSGVYEKFPMGETLSVSPFIDKLNDRIALTKQYLNLSKGVTAEIKEQTSADKAHEQVINILRKAHLEEKEALEKRNAEYQRRLKIAESMTGPAKKEDGSLTEKGKELGKVEEYRQKYVVKQEEKERDAWNNYQAAKNGNISTDDILNVLQQQQEENLKRIAKIKGEDAKATGEQNKATEQQISVTEKSNETNSNQAELLKKKAELEGKLADINGKLEEQQKEYDKTLSDANEKEKESNRLEKEAANLVGKHTEELQNRKDELAQYRKDAQADYDANQKNKQNLQETNSLIDEQGRVIHDNETIKAQANTDGIRKTEEAIRILTEENNNIDVNSDKWKENTAVIIQLQEALAGMKNQATLQMMGDRMSRVEQLSSSALSETKKFWEGMVAGAEKGSQELKTYEDNLKIITEEERKRNTEQTKKNASSLLGDITTMSEGEIRKAIDAAKQYQQALVTGSEEHKNFSEAIVAAEKRVSEFGLEAERVAQRQAESIRMMQDQLSKGDVLTESALKAQIQYWQRLADDPKTAAESVDLYKKNIEQAKKLLDDMYAKQTKDNAGMLMGDFTTMSEGELRNAISAAKEYQQTLVTGSEEHKKYSQAIIQAEEHLKVFGLEAERTNAKQAALDKQMRERMSDLPKLSESALSETKRYWEDMMRTQGLAEQKLSSYRIQLEKLIDEERRRKEVKAEGVIGNMGASSDDEIKKAIHAFEELRDAQSHGSDEWNYYNQRVQEGKKYLDDWAKTDSVIKFEEQMQKLPSLSDSALQETKKFWETMVAGAEKGSSELKDYESHLEKVKNEERERLQLANEMKARIVSRENLGIYSESEIRESINAAKELYSHMASTSPEAQKLAQSIANAEEHIKKYGIEAARAAKRQEESDEMMQRQFKTMTEDFKRLVMPSESAVKAQQKYWERLIDDPRTAAENLQFYRDQLNEVNKLQEAMVKVKGETAFQWFQSGSDKSASTDKAKEMAADLKAYRDTLPQDIEATKIEQIDNYLQKIVSSAKKAKEEVMSLEDAVAIADKAMEEQARITKEGWAESGEALKGAEKALADAVAKAKRGTKEEEEAYQKLVRQLQAVRTEINGGAVSGKKMMQVLQDPTSYKNIDTLKAAISRARMELNALGERIDQAKAERNEKEIKKLQQTYDELADSIKQTDIYMKELQNTSKGTAGAFSKAWSRLKTYITLYVGAAVAMQKITSTMGDLMELSDKMGEVRKTTGFTAEEVGALSENLKKLDVRTPLTQLMEVSAKAGQLGLKTEEDVRGFTEAANKMMIALPEMGAEAATEMMKVALATGEVDKIRKQMLEGTVEGSSAVAVAMTKIGSTIDQLRANSAAAAPQITDFVKRVGAVGAQSGISIDQVAALGASVDALGMRVEMSATALSRMIPAIKNNSFAVGKAIGVTQSWIDAQFKAGKGMDVILKIFDHIRQANMDADNIEQMFGSSMKDIMAELNQQGARAGIVFAGLSQGVDQLRKNLGIANKAYEENMAIEREFQKMNETTAAKWERLKNQIEEFFVSDRGQRRLGYLVDGLRKIVDLLTGEGGISSALRMIILYVAALKVGVGSFVAGSGMALKNLFVAIGSGINILVTGAGAAINGLTGMTNALRGVRAATIGARREWIKMDAAMKANVIGAIVTVLGVLILKLYDFIQTTKEAAAEIGRFNESIENEKRTLNSMFDALEDLNSTQEERSRLISEINSKYGEYLGFMLSETTSALQLADAHKLIAKRIREEAYEKRLLEQENAVKQKYGEDVNAAYGSLEQAVRESAPANVDAAEVAGNLKAFIDNRLDLLNVRWDGQLMPTEKYRKELGGYLSRLAADGKIYGEISRDLSFALRDYAKQSKMQYDKIAEATASTRADLRNTQRSIVEDINTNLSNLVENILNFAGNAAPSPVKPVEQPVEQNIKNTTEVNIQAPVVTGSSLNDILSIGSDNNVAQFPFWQANGSGRRTKTEIPSAPASWKPNVNEKDPKQVKKFIEYQNNLRRYLDTYSESISDEERNKAQSVLVSDEELRRLNELFPSNKNNGEQNPYGSYNAMDSYEKWDSDSLVKRRKQMLEYVRAMANGADIKAVLEKDKKFIDEATRKGIKDVRGAIEWYNTERLKIQEVLHDRYLTNTGDWKDPKKGSKKKPKTPESEEAIAELDRYYLERKERIEEARSSEQMTEAEYNRRIDELEQEHLKKRSDLRKTFTSKDMQFIEQFRQWWASVEELDEVSWEMIEAEWKVAWERDRKYNDRAAQKDLTQMQAIIVKQLKAIEDIIAKERPFDGITKNLQDNLTKMGILFKDGVSEEDFMKENTRRLTFLLKESEDAYNMTFDQLAEDMRKEGLGAWADAIIGSENADREKRAIIAQLHTVYDSVQDAIKREASQVKKQVDITWNDAILPNGKSIKATYEAAISALGVTQGRISRANSLIGAGASSERVADNLAIKQLQVQLRMQEHYYNLIRKTGQQRIDDLKREADEKRKIGKIDEAEQLELDAKHATMSLNLSLAKEQTELDKQRESIIEKTEESQNRLYKELKEWADLISTSVKGVMEASNAGNAEYYDELAKLKLTGKGGPGAGQYIIIDNSGTSEATAHYEYLSERQALERQREIEQQNAMAEAWRKLMDDLNNKMSEQITDWLNATLQNASIDANTTAVNLDTEATKSNTEALNLLSSRLEQGIRGNNGEGAPVDNGFAAGKQAYQERLSTETVQRSYMNTMYEPTGDLATDRQMASAAMSGIDPMTIAQQKIDASNMETEVITKNLEKQTRVTTDTNRKIQTGTQSTFAKMTVAANMYGVAYQAMSNDNLSTTQKFEMMALQAVGNYAISALTTEMATVSAKAAADSPGVLGTLWKQLGWAAAPVFAVFTGLLGGLMGLASSKISKAKSTIAQATGTSSVGAGRLSTGMMTYAGGNVNEFTDPNSLTPGRSYNVDGADGRTYRAKYMGKNAKTHITTGPEFHLVGEKGREAIIDAHTTRNIQTNDPEIWRTIQTLYSGRGMRYSSVRRGRGVRAFADGNLDDYEEIGSEMGTGMEEAGMTVEMAASLQVSIDRNNELLERALNEGIKGVFDVHGPGGLVNTYDTAKKEAVRHGERYT